MHDLAGMAAPALACDPQPRRLERCEFPVEIPCQQLADAVRVRQRQILGLAQLATPMGAREKELPEPGRTFATYIEI